MIKELKIEDIKKHEELILDMINSEIIRIDINSNHKINDGYILDLFEVISNEYSKKSIMELDVIIFSGLLDAILGINSDIFQEILKTKGITNTWASIKDAINTNKNSIFAIVYRELMENSSIKNNSGKIISDTIYDLANKFLEVGEDGNLEDLENQMKEFQRVAKQMQEIKI